MKVLTFEHLIANQAGQVGGWFWRNSISRHAFRFAYEHSLPPPVLVDVPREGVDNARIRLFNDSASTVREVVDALVKSCEVSPATAIDFAMEVHRSGDAVVLEGPPHSVVAAHSKLLAITRSRNVPLRAELEYT